MIQFYKLDESQKPITRMQPDIVPVELVGDTLHFWPVQRQPRGPRQVNVGIAVAQQPYEEGEINLDDTEGSDSDDDSDVLLVREPVAEEHCDLEDDILLEGIIAEEEGLDYMREMELKSHNAPARPASIIAQPIVPDSVVLGQAERIADPVVEARPAKQARVATASGPRMAALDCIDVANGRIAWYKNKSAFEAKCTVPSHNISGTCKLSRGCGTRRKGKDGLSLGGRPLGFLMAWLQVAHECPDKQSHWSKADWETKLTKEVRGACRAALAESLDGQALLSHEREKQPGEEDEPPTLDGLLA